MRAQGPKKVVAVNVPPNESPYHLLKHGWQRIYDLIMKDARRVAMLVLQKVEQYKHSGLHLLSPVSSWTNISGYASSGSVKFKATSLNIRFSDKLKILRSLPYQVNSPVNQVSRIMLLPKHPHGVKYKYNRRTNSNSRRTCHGVVVTAAELNCLTTLSLHPLCWSSVCPV